MKTSNSNTGSNLHYYWETKAASNFAALTPVMPLFQSIASQYSDTQIKSFRASH